MIFRLIIIIFLIACIPIGYINMKRGVISEKRFKGLCIGDIIFIIILLIGFMSTGGLT